MTHARYAIRGNHDHGAAQGVEIKGESGYRYLTRVSRRLVWDALGPDERRWLLQLPLTLRFNVGNKRFHMVHATPRDPLDEYLKHNPKLWAKRLKNVEADIVLVGHSHMQFNLAVNGTVVVNPGSVGQPRDGDPRASYLVLDPAAGAISWHRVGYDIEAVQAAMRAVGLPGFLVSRLSIGL
jgi:putative phosphoesterase